MVSNVESKYIDRATQADKVFYEQYKLHDMQTEIGQANKDHQNDSVKKTD